MRTNFSQQTSQEVIKQFEFRTSALLQKIESLENELRFTEAKLEVELNNL